MSTPENMLLIHIAWLIAGVVLALAFVRFAASRSYAVERRILAIGLIVAAGVYPVLCVLGEADSWLWIELVGLATFTAIALLGLFRSPLWLSGGWVLHAAWDSPLHLATSGSEFVPVGYVLLCLSFDLVVASSVYWRFRRADRLVGETG